MWRTCARGSVAVRHVICLAPWVLAVWPGGGAGAGEFAMAGRFRSEELRSWQDRLARLDQEAPRPELLGIETLVAYEENPDFAYAFGERPAQGGDPFPLRCRRVLLMKPNVLIVDDLWGAAKPHAKIVRVGWTAEAVVVPQDAAGQPEGLDRLRWSEAKDPVGGVHLPGDAGAAEPAGAAAGAASYGAVRTVCLFLLGGAGEVRKPIAFEPQACGEVWKLSLSFNRREFAIELPRRYLDAGWISASESQWGDPMVRRALPAGVLPHGEAGLALIERWDRPYRSAQPPGWDTGRPAEELVRAVEEGHVKPCRVIELGCGTGTNAVYLAGLGFDVTAVDVAPTALGVADAKARAAGVRVRWVLADALRLPDLGTFDLVFDRGCYHHLRYQDAGGFRDALCRLMRPGSRALIVSLNRDAPPGVREHMMREDFAGPFAIVWLKASDMQTGSDSSQRRPFWSLMLERK